MEINCPTQAQLPQLQDLWETVFGAYDGFWELFLQTGFSPERCYCLFQGAQITASLCWFDVSCHGQKMAYLYAVMTHPAYRNQGLCRRLLAAVHTRLRQLGYHACLLVPASEALRAMYCSLGYADATGISEFSCVPGPSSISLREVSPEDYARLRRHYLPDGAVIQEGSNLSFLAVQARLLAGTDFLLAAYDEGDTLHALEFLGRQSAAPGILNALGYSRGIFRTPGDEMPFAMFFPLTADALPPKYFGLAFD